MWSYERALSRVQKEARPLSPKLEPLANASGKVLARDIHAPEPSPRFDNSAVDGYAVSGPGEVYQVVGEIPAGECWKRPLERGSALRIFTGAPVPRGSYAVVMQEHAERRNGSVFILKAPRPKQNIRFRGEDFDEGKLLIKKGTPLQPKHLALLAALGFEKVPVYPCAQASILVTGSELAAGQRRLNPGEIRDSNTILLRSLVEQWKGIPARVVRLPDDLAKIRAAVRKALTHDLVLIAGGISVGKYDFVREALRREGVQEIFWKVNIKPGKPLYFGRREKTLVFALPGNPVSVFVTFELFVKPAMLKLHGRQDTPEKFATGRLDSNVQNGCRKHFLRVRCVPGSRGFKVQILKRQGSHMMGELASANALLELAPGARLKKNNVVQVRLIGGD